ncbi:MAG: hypothetical protein IKR94_01820 [Bacteroidales bacterium]|nr:hypothetical protein [Bacteroidales bacterium]MBR4214041.1 hypothetical protein [Bacteroidales bacterium]
MKALKLILAALVMTFIANISNAQGWIEEEDLQIFGNTRALSAKSDMVKFNKSTANVSTQTIEINNTQAEALEIVGFEAPAGITVLPKTKTIAGNSSSAITVTYYPEIAGDVENETIVIKTKPTNGNNAGKVSEKSFKIRFE